MSNIEGIVLAAGDSSRFGGLCKLTQLVDGVPMVRRAALAVVESRVTRITVVIGRHADAIRASLRDLQVHWVHNPNPERGLSSSVGLGMTNVSLRARGVVICLGDMPFVRSRHIEALCRAFEASGGESICVVSHRGKRGNPVLWPARFVAALSQMEGDCGGRQILAENASAVRDVPVAQPGVNLDIDTVEDLRALRRGKAR